MDLLTREEEAAEARTGHLPVPGRGALRGRLDIDLLAGRLASATDWLRQEAQTAALPLGYFGASTGAAAALTAATARPRDVAAVVSRGGRPDLAGHALQEVFTPTLLIVGSEDREVLELNRAASLSIPGPVRLAIVQGATHLFEEEGALEQVAELAGDWFTQHLGVTL
jgi:dienelactone hydrolase